MHKFSYKKWYYYFRLLVILVVVLPLLLGGCQSSKNNNESVPKAVIIDQLGMLQPNKDFIEKTTRELEDFGLKVDVYSGEKVIVELYRDLPSMGYKLIIFRVHSGLLTGNPKHEGMTWLYTNEFYRQTRHTLEQLTDQVTMAQVKQNDTKFFAVSSEYVTHTMVGNFNGAAIIMMGCDSMHLPDLATALVDKGASVCIGWHRSVGLEYVDDATPFLVDKLCTPNMTVVNALLQTMQEKGPDPDMGAILKYYPAQSGNMTLSELIHLK